MKVHIDVDPVMLDKLLVESLVEHHAYVDEEYRRLKAMDHPGTREEKKLRKAFKLVARYYTTQDEFNELGL
jgi:hypothetical protein